jgi:hydroxymethylpyrimidine/phosphomethylpyrimidine kinase
MQKTKLALCYLSAMTPPPIVWTIAGYDPSGGAGITADLKTISSHGCYGASCITALTVQNTLGVRRVEALSRRTVSETLQSLLDDLPPRAIKIGMLATAEVAAAVADFLQAMPLPRCPVVLDPILRSSSGAELLDGPGIEILRTRLLPLATVFTPNREEAALLTGLAAADAEAAAGMLRQLGAAAVVVTGGDSTGPEGDVLAEDVLAYSAGGMEFVETLSAPRLHSTATHGTGCAFSTSIACGLALGKNIPASVTAAKAFVRRAIELAPGIGHGRGPMGLESAGK